MEDGILFWRGRFEGNRIVIRQCWGATSSSGFVTTGSEDEPIAHPVGGEDTPMSDSRQAWLRSVVDGTSPSPLIESYLLPASTEQMIVESMSVDPLGAPTDVHLLGHVRLVRTTEPFLELTSAMRKSLHKLNNELSIVAMTVDVIAIKLGMLGLHGGISEEIADACKTASKVTHACGQMVSTELKRIHHFES